MERVDDGVVRLHVNQVNGHGSVTPTTSHRLADEPRQEVAVQVPFAELAKILLS